MHILPLALLLLQNENTSTNAGAAAGLMAFMGAYLIFVIVVLVISLIINWVIATKAGYPGAYSLLLLIPLVNIIIIILFAFTEWPIQRELKALRAGGRGLTPTA